MLAALLLLAAADPPGEPSLEQMTEILYEADNLCRNLSDPGFRPCAEIPRRRLEELRCTEVPGAEAARLLCIYSGLRTTIVGGTETPFGPECVYLGRFGVNAWRIEAYPDADVCETR